MQHCSISSALVIEILQSCTKTSKWCQLFEDWIVTSNSRIVRFGGVESLWCAFTRWVKIIQGVDAMSKRHSAFNVLSSLVWVIHNVLYDIEKCKFGIDHLYLSLEEAVCIHCVSICIFEVSINWTNRSYIYMTRILNDIYAYTYKWLCNDTYSRNIIHAPCIIIIILSSLQN